MKKNRIILIVIIASLLLIISIFIGMNTTKNQSHIDTPSTEHPIPTIPVKQVTLSTPTEITPLYKIKLVGETLMLYKNEEIVNQTPITPEVLPRADIKALMDGIDYYDGEKALMDWESLSK